MCISQKVILDYYQGAYGPTIRIDVVAFEDLERMCQLFNSLRNVDKLEIDLVGENIIRAFKIGKFILKSSSNYRQGTKRLTIFNRPEGKIDAIWEMTAGDWGLAVDLIEVFLKKLKPGHQYLTEESLDDALVEFSFRERPENTTCG